MRRIDPSPNLTEASESFLSAVREHLTELRVQYDLSSGYAWRGSDGTQWDADPGITYMHADKLDPRLRAELVEANLAFWDPEGWVGTHPRLARTYMSLLAEHICRASAATPVTDDPMAHLLGSHWSADQVAESLLGPIPRERTATHGNDLSASLAFISVRAVAPGAPLSVEEVLNLRDRYGDELMRFREMLTKSVSDAGLEAVERPDMLQLHLEDLYKQQIAPELAQLKRDLKLLNVNTIDALINLRTTLPPALALAAGQAGIQDPVVTTATAAVAGIVGITRSLTSAREEALSQSPTAFLWRINGTKS